MVFEVHAVGLARVAELNGGQGSGGSVELLDNPLVAGGGTGVLEGEQQADVGPVAVVKRCRVGVQPPQRHRGVVLDEREERLEVVVSFAVLTP